MNFITEWIVLKNSYSSKIKSMKKCIRIYVLLASILLFQFCNSQNSLGHSTIHRNNIIFIDTISSFNTIEDVINLPQFKGKVVYIDLWATTCVPCIREFSFEKQLQKKYQGKPVEFLYICYNSHDTANDRQRKRWKNIVIQQNLTGTHIYAHIMPPDKILHQIIDKDFLQKNENGVIAYGVPTYMIGKNGKILNYDAARPSEKDKVYNQIQSFLKE